MIVTNGSSKLALVDTQGQVLSEEIWRKCMCRSTLLQGDFNTRKSTKPYPTQMSQLQVEREKSEYLLHVLQEERTPNYGLLVTGTEEQRQEARPECRVFRIRATEV